MRNFVRQYRTVLVIDQWKELVAQVPQYRRPEERRGFRC